MTFEIGFLLLLLVLMVYFFLTEKLPIDVTAAAGLVILVSGGFLTAEEAFTGFSSPAVITMLSMFVVGAALLHTGVADRVGNRIHSWVGSGEVSLMITLMLVAGILSAFMNNIATTAVMMPAVATMARRAGLSPSRLFMPLSFGAILGGTTTLVGTPPNIVGASILQQQGLQPFGLFDFTALGQFHSCAASCSWWFWGVTCFPLGARLPASSSGRSDGHLSAPGPTVFDPHSEDSSLDGLTLEESGLGTALDVQVVAILQRKRRNLAPAAHSRLHGGDILLVEGQLQDLQELLRVQGVQIEEAQIGDLPRPTRNRTGVRVRMAEDSSLLGRTLREVRFREKFGLTVVGIQSGGEISRERLAQRPLRAGDELLALGDRSQLKGLRRQRDLQVDRVGLAAVQPLQESLFLIRVPADSSLVGATLKSSRIGELVGLTIGGIIRGGETKLAVSPSEPIRANDRFLVAGEPSRIRSLLPWGQVELDSEVRKEQLESEEVGIVEAALAPRSSLLERSLGDLDFRKRYGLQVLAIWRQGRPVRLNLVHLPLRIGDALLLQGPRERIRHLATDADFVVLSDKDPAPRRTHKAPVALASLGLMVALVISGFQPIQVAAFSAATLMILWGAIPMQEVYRAIEWRAILLVAAILPLGFAMERTGAALLLAETVQQWAGPGGPYALLAALILLSSLLSQGLDGAPAVVFLAPVVTQTAQQLSLSPYPLMIGVCLAASMAFMTPFSHKANLLVMGAGGYRSQDYLRVGTPLTLLLLALLVILIPRFFPFLPA